MIRLVNRSSITNDGVVRMNMMMLMPDPDPTKDQDPTQPEASKEDTPDETELTDEQLEQAAGGMIDGSTKFIND